LGHFLKDDKLFILLLYKNGEIEMIAPFLLKEERFKGINIRKIELIGNVYSPIGYVLFREHNYEERKKNLNYIFLYFRDAYKLWDVIDLQPIPEENDALLYLSEIVKNSRLKNKEYFCFGNWYSEGITYSSDLYFKNRSRNFRAVIRKNFNKAKRLGNIEFRVITDSMEIQTHMNIYLEVYSKSWKKREALGYDFIMDWIKKTAQKGWLRLGLVLLDQVAIGMGFAIVYGKCAYFQKTAYDEKYEEIGPGTIWYTEMIRHVIDIDNVHIIDFLRGDDEHKKRWLEKRRERKGVLIFNKNAKGQFLNFLIQNILPAINNHNSLRAFKNLVVHKLLKTN
jgi:hypothetical protein